MKILFCNIAWMKSYKGINEDDAPSYGGEHSRKSKEGTEGVNFRDYNGKCYGFFELKGSINLEKYFEEATAEQASVEKVLVIWVAANQKSETKIVGWYTDATLFREVQAIESYFFPEFSRYYRIEALSKNCHLLSESDRDYPVDLNGLAQFAAKIQHSNAWYYDDTKQEATGLPQLREYIEENQGSFLQTYLSEELLDERLPESDKDHRGYQELLDKGRELYDNWETLKALKYFNTARAVSETTEVLWEIYYCLFELIRLDRAKVGMDRIVEMEGPDKDTVRQYIGIYDALGNREKTLEYCENYMQYEPQSSEDKEVLVGISNVMFSIYYTRKDRKNAEASLKRAMKYTSDNKTLSIMNKSMEFLNSASRSWK